MILRRPWRPRWLVAGLFAVLAGCATAPDRGMLPPDRGDVLPAPIPPAESPAIELGRGKASWYGPRFHGRRTASGERFDMNALTAAHPTLAFGTLVRVRHVGNGREVVVRINDRGPHVKQRIIDLSKAAAEAIGLLQAGEAPVVLFPH